MQFLKANTVIDVLIGPFVDETDGATLLTSLVLSQADILVSKNGGTLAAKSDTASASADSTTGYYKCDLNATDTGAEGCLVIVVNESGALPVRHEYMVLSEAAYDSMFAAKDTGFMDVTLANGDHGGPEATLALEHVEVISTTTDQAAIVLTGEGAGAGLESNGGENGNGVDFLTDAPLRSGLYARATATTSHGATFSTGGTAGTGM